MKSEKLFISIVCLLLIGILGSSAFAVQPSKDVIRQLKESGRFDEYVEQMRNLRAGGWDQPDRKLSDQSFALNAAPDTHKVLVILIDFYDKTWESGFAAADSADFDSTLFSDGVNPTGSMKEFYLENSYGKYVIIGSVTKWYRAMWGYADYNGIFDSDDMVNFSPSDLVKEAVLEADPDVNFSQFARGGVIEGIIVVHAGTGYEESGNSREIHSHMSSLNMVPIDGVHIARYTIQPEETYGGRTMSAIGVFCHEWGHIAGLPDLYDIDYSSRGLGDWSLMAGGNYNNSSRSPAHMDAWCKNYLGWINLTRIISNTENIEIPAVEYSPFALRLNRNGIISGQYWIVENRQRVGFDIGIPGDGLLIYHIDESVPGNSNDWHPLVFIEQADGKFDLQNNANRGDASDPFPGTDGVRTFHDMTIPGSKYYGTASSEVALWNISDSDSIMTADVEVRFSRPWLENSWVNFSDAAYGDNDSMLEAGETIQVILAITNLWDNAQGVTATIWSADSSLTMTVDEADFGSLGNMQMGINSGFPFEFTLPGVVETHLDSIFFDITANNGQYQTQFGVEVVLGQIQVLIVDDDNGDLDSLEQYLVQPLYDMRIPAKVWDKNLLGPPNAPDLLDYHVVMWLTGSYRNSILEFADINAIKGYLDGGGNLFLTGQGLASQLSDGNNAFLNDYLKVDYRDSTFNHIPILHPTQGSFSIGSQYILFNASGADILNQTVFDHIYSIGDGAAEYQYHNVGQGSDYGVVSYAGQDYKTIFFAFGFESIINRSDSETRDELMDRLLAFFGDFPLDAGDEGEFAIMPTQINLNQNFPNPFNPTTEISYVIKGNSGPRIDRTRLEIYNVLGQKVITLVDRYEAPGEHTVIWQGEDQNGSRVSSGMYFYRLSRGDMNQTKKMLLLK